MVRPNHIGATPHPAPAVLRPAQPYLSGVRATHQRQVRGHHGEFMLAAGKAAHGKHQFQIGMTISGLAIPVPDPRMETAGYYKASGIKVGPVAEALSSDASPFTGVAPDLETYRARGHRRLDTRTYESKCAACIWGCRMPVEMIVDQWNPSVKRYRFETFCYGPKNCKLYRPGPQRKVPGRKGMTYTEEDWVDEDATAHRGLNN